ncbi:MAG: glycoside hydrolase family 97 protein [Gemmatimonadetes bacterium]|nr:glycoside hydrolase family 97 protein [Gemmatimonadota bacterium]
MEYAMTACRPGVLALLVMTACAPAVMTATVENTRTITTPHGRVVVDVWLDTAGAPRYLVQLGGEPVLQESRLGLVRDDADFSTGLRLRAVTPTEAVADRYETPTAKRRVNEYRAHRRVFQLETAAGQRLDLVFQVSDDGVGFRYVFPDTSAEVRRLLEEVTSYRLLPDARAWLQPMQVVGTGWGGSNPAYEEYYQQDIPAGTPSTLGAGWVYPALFRSGSAWLLVSETGLGRNYAGTRLRHESPGGEYRVGFPDPRESRMGGPVNPTSTLPWSSPWRVLVVGSLQTIAESMLGIDLADPPAVRPAGEIVPGKAAWSWPLLGDRRIDFDTQKEFVDYAASLGWRYVLVDNYWDRQIGYEKIQELIDYAKPKSVGILLWYNSAGPWNTTPQTPRDRMLTHESRVAEFQRLKQMGVAGLKIDFFGADGQSMIAYYHDIMIDAAPYGLLLNFHGATLPRGWSRTYPHLMTMEGIKGLEFATFEQVNADQVPTHATMLPFTRNVFDPMDFTPMALDRFPRTERKTTPAAELAQAILFTSGIQHYAEIPAGMAKAPEYVRTFLRGIPSIWDDVRFLAGYPGKYVVLARRSGERWWLAGLNGEDTERELTLDLREVAGGKSLVLITEGDDALGFARRVVPVPKTGELVVKLKARGGFAAGPEQRD